jgi:superfamily I DNA/RNA helicase
MPDTSWWVDSNELDDEQLGIIELAPEGSFLVSGPPGSGTTNLLLLRASYLVDAQKPNVAVLMFTRSLREFVVRGTGNYSFAADKVQTIAKWAQTLIREHGGAIPPDEMSFSERRRAMAVELKRIFDEKAALTGHLDCVLVDEVQDCLPEEIDLFFRAGRAVFLVGDHRQQIYDKNGTLDSLEDRIVKRTLSKHYRNGEAICRVADAVGKTMGELPLLSSCNYDETKAKSGVNFEECRDEDALYESLSARLAAQLKTYPDELLGVATPKNADVQKLRSALASDPRTSQFLLPEGEFDDPFDKVRRICVCTMHDAKGLEFRCMHLALVENLKKMGSTQKRLAFTSITRSKTALSVYCVNPMPGYMEAAREAVAVPKPPPNVRSLFPAGRKS